MTSLLCDPHVWSGRAMQEVLLELAEQRFCAAHVLSHPCLSWVKTDKTHCEHNESGYRSFADMRADINQRRLVPTADSCTAMKPMRIITEDKANRRLFPSIPIATMRVKGLISRLKGDFANKPSRTPVETRFAL